MLKLSDLCQNFCKSISHSRNLYIDVSHGDDELNITEFMSTWGGAVGGDKSVFDVILS